MTVDELKKRIGSRTGTSSWVQIDQDRIDTFADVTEDWQFIHVDPARTAAETALPGTIAHGFLTLSLLSKMTYEVRETLDNTIMGYNYGFEKIRFLAPVIAGSRVRAHFDLEAVEERKPGEILTTSKVTMEIEGQEKPALVAEWLGLTIVEVKP